MTVLDTLNFVAFKPLANTNPIAVRRRKLAAKIDEQILLATDKGYTLALDFKVSETAIKTVKKLEDMVVEMGGRLYLTKDAVMQESTFKATYPYWEKFEAVREQYGAIGKFRSAQSKRLGLA